MCGRLGDGRSFPMFICLDSRESCELVWTPQLLSSIIFDFGLKPLPWRYIINAKGDITEDYCAIYLADIIYPSMGHPKSIESHPR
jgi:hypothetical protein